MAGGYASWGIWQVGRADGSNLVKLHTAQCMDPDQPSDMVFSGMPMMVYIQFEASVDLD